MLITFGHVKGGEGKSTLCWHVGIALKQAGYQVIWVDANPRQRSITKLRANSRMLNHDSLAAQIPCELLENNVGASLDALEKANPESILICDVPGYDCPALQEAMVMSDVFIVPTKPSQMSLQDLPELMAIRANIERKHGFAPNIRLLLNMASTNPMIKDWERAITAIEQSGIENTAPRLPLIIYHRAAFSEAPEAGVGVTEYAKIKPSAKKAADEITDLVHIIAGAKT